MLTDPIHTPLHPVPYPSNPVPQKGTRSAPTPAEPASLTIFEAMRAARRQAEQTAQRFKVRLPVRYGDVPMMAYARLARARNRAEVQSAAGYARRRIAQLRSALRQDPDHQDAIRTALRQLEKLSIRAARKQRDMDQERILQLQRHKAAEQAQKREEARLTQEVQRRRVLRAIREESYLHEAAIEQGMQAYRAAKAAELAAQLPSRSPAPTPMSAADAASPSPPVIPAEVGFSIQA